MKLDDFICDKCGECCKHIDLIPELNKFNNNGSCKFLENNLCTIYNIRPSSCRVSGHREKSESEPDIRMNQRYVRIGKNALQYLSSL